MTIDLTTGDDSYNDDLAHVSTETINGLDGNDSLTVNGNSNTLNGGDGDDTLISYGVGTILNGGLGIDTITTGFGSTVDAGDGDDIIHAQSHESFVTLVHAGAGNDTIESLEYRHFNTKGRYFGDDGDDTIRVNGGSDHIDGGSGADTIEVNFISDVMTEIYGGDDNDTIIVGNASINGIIDGGAGTDRLYLSGQNFQVAGGADDDTIVAGIATGETSGSAIDYSNVNGGDGNDTFNGTFRWGTLLGGAGDDRFKVASAAETISGGVGDDIINLRDDSGKVTVNGDAGDDTLIFVFTTGNSAPVDRQISFKGGTGNDTYRVDAHEIKITEVLNQGIDTVKTRLAEYTLASNVENLTAVGSKQSLTGNALNNKLLGSAGADHLSGLVGTDTLSGGAGADHFVYNAISEGGDHITDFGANDVIDLKGSAFGGLKAGALTASMFRSAAAHVARDANDHFLFDTRNGQLWYDADGNKAGAAKLIVDLDTAFKMTALDIHII